MKRWTICPGQRVLIFCREIRSFSRLLTPILSRQRERGCQKIGTFGESAAKGNQDILSFIRETEKILKRLWLVVAKIIQFLLPDVCLSCSAVFETSSSGCQLDQPAPPRVLLDKCGSDIGAAGMPSKYRHAVQICPKYSQFWNFAYYHSPGQDGIGVGRSRNNELPMEFICPQWLQTETLGKGKGGTRRKCVLEKLCDFRGRFV